MKAIRIAIVILMLGLFFTSCKKYDDYIKNYDYSAVYFAAQAPVRTIVAYDTMEFKVGVALAGVRNNYQDQWVSFEIDTALLSNHDVVGGNKFKLLPENYFSLSNDSMMIIPRGRFIGAVTVTLNKQEFTTDPLAIENTYALPLRILRTSADSVLRGSFDDDGNQSIASKDYTVIVVKYISRYSGYYYHKGIEKIYDQNGVLIDQNVYSHADLSQNELWDLATLSSNKVETPGIGTQFSSTSTKNAFVITVTDGKTLDLAAATGSSISIEGGSGNYDVDTHSFYLKYGYTFQGDKYIVNDTLVRRQAPEKDLRFEEW